MVRTTLLPAAGLVALFTLAAPASAQAPDGTICVDCLEIRVGPPTVVRGPFPDELDATFTALKLPDGTMRAFTANGATYVVDGPDLWHLAGPRREVLPVGAPDGPGNCGQWLTTAVQTADTLFGFVHHERDCDYNLGQTGKSMAIATSDDFGLSWTAPVTVITGSDTARPGAITGEGDCSLVDGEDGYLYAYCLRNSDWQTIAARAPVNDPTHWQKYFEGGWTQPGLGGQATAIGFLGPGAGYIADAGVVATVTADQWFGGVRLSFSRDKVSFTDVDEPLILVEGSEWGRPAPTNLVAYTTVVNPETGSNRIGQDFLLSYIHVPANKGFESRYLVHQAVSITIHDAPVPVQTGLALARWTDGSDYVTSTGPLTGDRSGFVQDSVVAYLLTKAPDGVESVKIAECSDRGTGNLLAPDGGCEADGLVRERTAGWLFATEQPGSVPVYRCINSGSHFASASGNCEGLGTMEFVLGYGLTP